MMDFNTICIAFIITVFVIELVVVISLKSNHKIISYKRVVDYFPSSLSTLGVLGTFIGIYLGLREFDPRNIQASIPVLLDGLKTAFSTSLWGMGLSLGFSFLISLLTDRDEEKNPTEFDKLAVKISEAVDKMSTAVVDSMERVRQQIDRQTQNIQNNHGDISAIVNDLKSIKSVLETELPKVRTSLDKVGQWTKVDFEESFRELSSEVSVCRLKLSQTEEHFENMAKSEDNRTKLLNDILKKSITDVQQKLLECDKQFQEKLLEGEKILQGNMQKGNEQVQQLLIQCNQQVSSNLQECDRIIQERIVQIEGILDENMLKGNSEITQKLIECDRLVKDRLADCNKLLDQKLDVFGTSIAKSNTQALSSVMTAACLEFQSTMDNAIKTLIKENFSELNANIHRLNEWQQSNMTTMSEVANKCNRVVVALESAGNEMSQSVQTSVSSVIEEIRKAAKEMCYNMTSQQENMSRVFNDSVASLAKVAEYTQAINGAEGELGNLVEALKRVVISDQSFVNVSKNLTASIAKNADSIEQLNNITLNLKTWLLNSNNMQTQIQKLITKLEDLNQMRDFNDKFWASTKAQLAEGINVLKDGSKELNKQLDSIDRHFYERLSVTMENLDECLAQLVSKNIVSEDKQQ